MPSIAYLDFKYERASTVNKIYDDAFTITALVDDCQIIFYADDSYPVALSISYDNGLTWTDISLPGESNLYYPNPIDTGQTIMIVGRGNHRRTGLRGFRILSEQDNYFSVSGKLLTLLDVDETSIRNNGGLSNLTYCFNLLFSWVTYSGIPYMSSIKDASNLIFPNLQPSTHCYWSMFNGCSSLEKSPTILPATTLAANCYSSMFSNCSSLTTAPELPATTLADNCYWGMFNGCSSLTTAPELPATTLAAYCYFSMFYNCTSLTVAPRLNATTLAYRCYRDMFSNCSSLTTAPELPATTLVNQCYRSMFSNCSSLTTAPELPATTLVNQCYRDMFEGCELLNYIKILATDTDGNNTSTYLRNWVRNVAPTGTFIKDVNMVYDIDNVNGVPIGWTVYDVGEEIIHTYTVTLNVNPENTGSIMNNPVGTNTYVGTFQENTSITITAQPASGYNFDGWYSGNTLISSNASYTFTVNSNVIYTAKFSEDQTVYYTIFVQQNIDGGTVPTGDGTYVANSSCTITAYNHPGYTFVGWELNGTIVSNNLSYTFTVDNTYTFIAKYIVTPQTPEWTVTLYSSDDTRGHCTGSGTYTAGTLVTVEAVANTGYVFARWKDENGYIYSTDNPLSFNITENIVLFADFDVTDTYAHDYLTIEALDDNIQVVMTALNYYDGELHNFNLWYWKSTDPSWQKITFDYSENDLTTGWANSRTICTLNDGQSVRIHTDAHTMNYNNSTVNRVFSVFNVNETSPDGYASQYLYNARFNVYGNILSLVDYPSATSAGTNYGNPIYPTFSNLTLEPYAFSKLFKNTQLMSAYNLRILYANSVGLYNETFASCMSMSWTPLLPATTLSPKCYKGMFNGCVSLTDNRTLSILPATTLSQECYAEMFEGCTSLTTAPELPATTLAQACYMAMFENCYNLSVAPELPATTLAPQCYTEMFYNCWALMRAPELPATTLVAGCYSSMFYWCYSLNYIKCLATTDIEEGNCYEWVYAVESSGTFVKDPNATWTTGASGIPTGWTVEDAS